jgi:hypothetical protein
MTQCECLPVLTMNALTVAALVALGMLVLNLAFAAVGYSVLLVSWIVRSQR